MADCLKCEYISADNICPRCGAVYEKVKKRLIEKLNSVSDKCISLLAEVKNLKITVNNKISELDYKNDEQVNNLIADINYTVENLESIIKFVTVIEIDRNTNSTLDNYMKQADELTENFHKIKKFSFGGDSLRKPTITTILNDALTQENSSETTAISTDQFEFSKGVGVISAKNKKILRDNIGEEKCHYHLVSNLDQVLVCTENKIVILKSGTAADVVFGYKCTSFHFDDIIGIEVQTKAIFAALEILTPAHNSVKFNFYPSLIFIDWKSDPYSLENVLPLDYSKIDEYMKYLNIIKKLISSHRTKKATPRANTTSISDELLKLAGLLDKGLINKEEFDVAKAKLLQ